MAERLRFALFGHPVGHSISPAIHRAAFAALGLPHVYDAIDLPSEEALALAVAALRRGELAGANVTVPYKRAGLLMADVASPSAARVGAANVLCREGAASSAEEAGAPRVVAHNTDADALREEIAGALGDHGGATAVVLGAGGAALAAVVALKDLGFRSIAVTTRSWSSPDELLASPSAAVIRAAGAVTLPSPLDLSAASPLSAELSAAREAFAGWIERADVLVQATSAGMRGAASGEAVAALIPWDRVRASALAYELIYNPRVTPFLARAQARGLAALGGLGMLVRQAALSLALWTGEAPPLGVMRAAAEQAMAAAQ